MGHLYDICKREEGGGIRRKQRIKREGKATRYTITDEKEETKRERDSYGGKGRVRRGGRRDVVV